jgi:hypothetical protein
VIVNICSKVGSMLLFFHDRDKNFDQSYNESNYLNHITFGFWKDLNKRFNFRYSLKVMTTIICDFLLNIEHYDHTSVGPKQSEQLPSIGFLNHLIYSLLLCARTSLPLPHPHFFVSKAEKLDRVDGPDTEKSEWIKLEFFIDSYNPELVSKFF